MARTAAPPASAAAVRHGPGERLVTILIVLSTIVTTLLLVREIFDFIADGGKPAMRQNDLYSALGSVAVLGFLGILAFGQFKRRGKATG